MFVSNFGSNFTGDMRIDTISRVFILVQVLVVAGSVLQYYTVVPPAPFSSFDKNPNVYVSVHHLPLVGGGPTGGGALVFTHYTGRGKVIIRSPPRAAPPFNKNFFDCS